MTRPAILVAVSGLLIVSLVASQACRTAPKGPRLPATVTIPFELVNRHVMLKATVGGSSRPLWVILDTGDKFAVLDLDAARELGLKLGKAVRVQGVGAETEGAWVDGTSISISGLSGFSQPVRLAFPLRNLADRLGHRFDGIVGSELIEEFVVEIDYEKRVVRFHDKEQFTYSGPGESIPIRLSSSGHPVFEAEVTPVGKNPIRGELVLDIGASSALDLRSPFVAEHKLPGPNVKIVRQIGKAGAGGHSTGKMGRVAALKIGRFTFTAPVTFFSEDRTGSHAGSATIGSIGHQVAGRFKIFLDYSHDRVILEPSTAFSEPFHAVSSGLVLHGIGEDHKTFRIADVLESSPAAEADLREGDVIVSIDDQGASRWTLTQLLQAFERPVARKLTVVRGERTLHVTLTPRPLV